MNSSQTYSFYILLSQWIIWVDKMTTFEQFWKICYFNSQVWGTWTWEFYSNVRIFLSNPHQIHPNLLFLFYTIPINHLSWKNDIFWAVLKNLLFPFPSLGHVNLGISLKCLNFSPKPPSNTSKLTFPILYYPNKSFELIKWHHLSSSEKFAISIPKFGARELGNFTQMSEFFSQTPIKSIQTYFSYFILSQ